MSSHDAPLLVRQKSVLVVDDDNQLRPLFRDALRHSGFDVRAAADGTEALQLIELDMPDLVVLDLGLPTLDGVSVAQELAANPRARDVKVIVVTGSDMDTGKLPAARVMRKPFSIDQLVGVVRSVAGA